MIFVIDDEEAMAKCIKRAAKKETRIFNNAIDAMTEVANGEMPDLIFLDILLDGPDGFTFLNEMVSYNDTAKVPVVLVTSLELPKVDYGVYGVVGILNKETMTPEDIRGYAKQYCK